MIIPKKIKIGAVIYKVVERDMDDCGQVDWKTKTISIHKDHPPEVQSAHLVHEIFHVINNEIDHVLLDSLANQIHQVLEENKLY